MDRRPGSGRSRITTSEENKEMTEDQIYLQEENPGTHMSPKKIEKYTGISRFSVERMVKSKEFKQFKHLKTTQMSDGWKEGWKELASQLNNSAKTPQALKCGRMKKILLLKSLPVHKTVVFM